MLPKEHHFQAYARSSTCELHSLARVGLIRDWRRLARGDIFLLWGVSLDNRGTYQGQYVLLFFPDLNVRTVVGDFGEIYNTRPEAVLNAFTFGFAGHCTSVVPVPPLQYSCCYRNK